MTIRPVYERPRVLRTLLCLLVGVLALLWRAVPSFPWVPNNMCVPGDTHYMQERDTAYFEASTMKCAYVPSDIGMMTYWNGLRWEPMGPATPYGYYTTMRYWTYTCVATHCVWHDICFRVDLFGFIHRNKRGASYTHFQNCWNVACEFHGYELSMTRESA